MAYFFLQIPPPPPGSIDPFVGWLLALVLGGFTAALSKMYLDSRAESKRKDEMIDRLLADLTPRVSRAEERQDRGR